MGSLLLVDGDEIHVGKRFEVDILCGHDERIDGDLRLLRDELARLCVVGDHNDFFQRTLDRGVDDDFGAGFCRGLHLEGNAFTGIGCYRVGSVSPPLGVVVFTADDGQQCDAQAREDQSFHTTGFSDGVLGRWRPKAPCGLFDRGPFASDRKLGRPAGGIGAMRDPTSQR